MSKITVFSIFVVLSLLVLGCSLGLDSFQWLYDAWITTSSPDDFSMVFVFHSDGAYVLYADYAQTIPAGAGNFIINKDTIMMDLGSGMTPYPYVKINGNHCRIMTGAGIIDFYRKSAYPVSGPTPTDYSWLYDSWIDTTTPVAGSDVWAFNSSGVMTQYDDYDETTVIASGTYTIDDTTLFIDDGSVSITFTYTQVDANHFIMTYGAYTVDLYRKSLYPVTPFDPSLIYDSWIQTDSPFPTTQVTVFNSDGTFDVYNDYNETNFYMSGTYTIDSSTISLDMGMGATVYDYIIISPNQLELTFGMSVVNLYRKSAYPCGTIPSITVNGGWVEVTLALGEITYLSFDGTLGTSYTVYWDDSFDGTGTYDADVYVATYHQDLATYIFSPTDSGYTFPRNFTATATETMYLEINAFFSGGTLAIRVTSP